MTTTTQEKVSLTLKNAFHKDYEVKALPREAIEEIISELNPVDVYALGLKEHCDNYGTTYISIDLRDGKLTASYFSSGSGDIENSHLVDVATIGQNTLEDNNDVEDLLAYIEEKGNEKLAKDIESKKDEIDAYELHEYAYENGICQQSYQQWLFLWEIENSNSENLLKDDHEIGHELDEIYGEK